VYGIMKILSKIVKTKLSACTAGRHKQEWSYCSYYS